MAVIVVDIQSILGESQIVDYEDKIDALSIRETIETAALQGSGRIRGARTVGQSRHSDIELTRYKDRASPKLAVACSSGMNLGEVSISLFRSIESGIVPYMRYTLSQTFVSRIEHDTLDENGVAFQPHFVDNSATSPPSTAGVGSIVAIIARQQNSGRLAPRSITGIPRGADTNREVERIWLNASQVRWTYTPFHFGRAGGAVERTWNIQQGAEL